MTELLLNPVFVSLAAGVVIVLGTSIVHQWGKVRKASIEAELKRDMIARGMSADEICRIVESGTGSAKADCCD